MNWGALLAALVVVSGNPGFAETRPAFDPLVVVRRIRKPETRPVVRGEEPRDEGEFMVDTSYTLMPVPGRQPSVAFDGSNFLVVWQDWRDGDSSIYGTRVTPAGTVLDPSGFLVSQAAGSQGLPAVAFDGANFLVVWQVSFGDSNSDICGSRVTPAGMVIDSSDVIISGAVGNQEAPAVGFDGTNFLVTWQDFRGGLTSDIYGARVT